MLLNAAYYYISSQIPFQIIAASFHIEEAHCWISAQASKGGSHPFKLSQYALTYHLSFWNIGKGMDSYIES